MSHPGTSIPLSCAYTADPVGAEKFPCFSGTWAGKWGQHGLRHPAVPHHSLSRAEGQPRGSLQHPLSPVHPPWSQRRSDAWLFVIDKAEEPSTASRFPLRRYNRAGKCHHPLPTQLGRGPLTVVHPLGQPQKVQGWGEEGGEEGCCYQGNYALPVSIATAPLDRSPSLPAVAQATHGLSQLLQLWGTWNLGWE